jgi:hypothetical protein
MFEGKVMNLPQGGAPEWCFARVGPGLTFKHQTWLEMLDKDKHSSLIPIFVYYSGKKVILHRAMDNVVDLKDPWT